MSGGEGRMLPMANGHARGAQAAVLAQLIRPRTTKPHTIIMSSRSTCHNGQDCLLEVDTATGKSKLIKAGGEHTAAWVVDRTGKPVAREDWDWQKSAYHLYALSGDNIKEILRTADTNPPILAGLLPDDSALVLLASNGRPHQAAWALR